MTKKKKPTLRASCSNHITTISYIYIISYIVYIQAKIHQYTKDLLDNVTSMISNKLGTPKPEIPKSMEAPYMRLVLLPEYEGYPAGTDVRTNYFCI